MTEITCSLFINLRIYQNVMHQFNSMLHFPAATNFNEILFAILQLIKIDWPTKYTFAMGIRRFEMLLYVE